MKKGSFAPAGDWLPIAAADGVGRARVRVRRVRPAAPSSYAYVIPVIAMFLGVALAGETITAAEWAAMPVILAGGAIVMVAHGRAEAAAAAAGRHGTVRS